MNFLSPFLGAPPSTDLISFNAGRINTSRMPDGKYQCKADPKRGLIKLTKSSSDGLLHFCYIDRNTNSTVDDKIVFPNTTSFKKAKTGRPEDRVYVLLGQNFPPLLFWMQDKDSSKDAENVEKLNKHLTTTPSAPAAAAASSTPAGGLDLSSVIRTVTENLNNGQSVSTQLNFQTPTSSAAPATPAAPAPSVPAMARITPLEDIITSERIINSNILSDPQVAAELTNLLPPGQQTPDQLEANIRSPQFRQSLSVLGEALQSENFNAVVSSFGIDPAPGVTQLNRGDGIGAFLASVQAESESKNNENSGSADGGNDNNNTDNQSKPSSDKMEE